MSGEQADNKIIESNIVRNILNNKKTEFPTDNDHISLPNTTEEIKQLSIDDKKLFKEAELKKNGRDVNP